MLADQEVLVRQLEAAEHKLQEHVACICSSHHRLPAARGSATGITAAPQCPGPCWQRTAVGCICWLPYTILPGWQPVVGFENLSVAETFAPVV